MKSGKTLNEGHLLYPKGKILVCIPHPETDLLKKFKLASWSVIHGIHSLIIERRRLQRPRSIVAPSASRVAIQLPTEKPTGLVYEKYYKMGAEGGGAEECLKVLYDI